ncbi:hypothetical protein Kpol_479p19 [Vanderwaltozyma polyspora DSM 70294]|uniref:Uncharacterized protein n=1 Tax=Vanderwaltozyma polyspora (strain ATCC 22028 / DSM 70294 / BCRC 21397 / CBS 2163 / NBRC 10782 / NRRL Y-8283 / UCD 57-17) TaxID=436907 RepID=A7TQD2_VANPO|nr:uncharacterized protein Kpol_479p19 [Vanderwaltozyma polyspora DSM 70294]EDO15531.1 hypothetical protein Kpol_479p19 [Vanderwaltozyma polyspora DSM 70294]
MVRMGKRFYDIAVNATDCMFHGSYNGKKYHDIDLINVFKRAYQQNVLCCLLTGSSIKESIITKSIANEYATTSLFKLPSLYYTIGVHPCSVNEFITYNNNYNNKTDHTLSNDQFFQLAQDSPLVPVENLNLLLQLWKDSLNDPKFRALGEMGLDYDRLNYSSKEMQLLFFKEQLKLSCDPQLQHLPLFLHMRNCSEDFIPILNQFINGYHDTSMISPNDPPRLYKFSDQRLMVVHSFTDSTQDMCDLVNLSPNIYIGLNGASLRSQQNLDTVKEIPLDRILIETDSPWCEIRKSHPSYQWLHKEDGEIQPRYEEPYKTVKKDKLQGKPDDEKQVTMVKSRNEPCLVEQVAIVVSQLKNIPYDEFVDTVWETSCKIYGE